MLAAAPVATAQQGGAGLDGSSLHAQAVSKSGVYIVVMKGDPAAAYKGGIAGLRATKPAAGKKLDRRNADVTRYAAHLDGQHAQALAAAGVPRTALLSSYKYAANGFSATLTAEQASALAALPSVRLVTPDVVRHIDAVAGTGSPTSAAFLGLTDKKGAYASGLNGEGVIVGVIDTGIWPEHPSLNPAGYGPAPATWAGTGCDFGNTAFNANDVPFTCNNKLLAAKKYVAGIAAGGANLVAGSYYSARDEDGHGTHTTTTAAGNAGVPASILGSNFGKVTGIAPRARVAMYKACWETVTGAGCSGADTAAAIDDAVADGVDVINFSIGGPTPAFSLDDLSFLFAADAGVFVARSAGNEGPAPATVGTAAVSPWVTAVGASTTDSTFEGTVTLGNGLTFRGASVTGGVGPATIVDAAALGNPLCLGTVAFTAPVTGDIVLCKRGNNARVDKGLTVKNAGGVGMVLYNAVSPQATVTDNHWVPSVHISKEDGLAVLAYINGAAGAATATIGSATRVAAQGSVIADFSSRGPNGFSEDIITPDVTAPGVNILAGNTPTALASAQGQLFQAISGTSMAAPHVAGIYALLKQAHRDWSPAEAKSALMTTARQNVVKDDGITPADPFDFGAGHVKPGGAVGAKGSLFNPGVVYDADTLDYLGFTCESFPLLPTVFFGDSACADLAAAGVPTTAENLNQASIGVGDVTGSATVTRTLTNVSGKAIEIEAKVKAPAGFKVTVSPRELKIKAGASKSFTVTFTRTTAAFDSWSFGSLTWVGSGYSARSPIAVKAKEFSAPAQAFGSDVSGTVDLPVKFGYGGTYSATALGAVNANAVSGVVVQDPARDLNTALANNDFSFEIVTVPAGTALTRIGLRNSDTTPGADFDLYVFDADFNQVGSSAGPTAHETVDLVNPAAGEYFVVIHGFDTVDPTAPYTLYDWSVSRTATGGSLSIGAAPASAVVSTAGTVTVNWAGADPAQEQIGAVLHNGPNGDLAVTLVELNGKD
jgi:subtilisin family serine protease